MFAAGPGPSLTAVLLAVYVFRTVSCRALAIASLQIYTCS